MHYQQISILNSIGLEIFVSIETKGKKKEREVKNKKRRIERQGYMVSDNATATSVKT